MVVDRRGIPLAVRQSAANLHDSPMLASMLDAIEPMKRPTGRPRKRPDKLHGDKGYDYPNCRRAVSQRGIKVRIARKGVESSERLGRHRWVVERTGSWLNNYRRLRIRYERLEDIHQAFLDLGCALICWNFLCQEFWNALLGLYALVLTQQTAFVRGQTIYAFLQSLFLRSIPQNPLTLQEFAQAA
jgi:transposase